MTDQIRAALQQWAKIILENAENWDTDAVHKGLQELYELSIINKHLITSDAPAGTEWHYYEAKLKAVIESITALSASESVSTRDETQKSLEVPPMMETIKDMVTEMPEVEPLFEEIHETPTFVEKETRTPSDKEAPREQNLNDRLSKGLKIGLNDRIAFINHLFDKDAKAYEQVLSQIQTFGDWEEVQHFIHKIVKPEYENWEGLEMYENRFLTILENKFTSPQ